MTRQPKGPNQRWDFEYCPRSKFPAFNTPSDDLIVAGVQRLHPDEVRRATANLDGDARVEEVAAAAPIPWVRARFQRPVTPDALTGCLQNAGLPLRYVASSKHGSLRLGARLGCFPAPSDPDWCPRSSSPSPDTSGCWSHGPLGVNVDRTRFGRGKGTRLAVIDDDAADLALAGVDAEVLVNLQRRPRAQPHGTLMLGWAVGTAALCGVAPCASPRLYCIPKPDVDVVSLPTAIIRAVADGADVVLCPSYLEGATSPMLDDALEFASRFGRGGRGSIVVVPTGREACSAQGSSHVSWSLGFGEPASDPRVVCVAPSGRTGGWFLWPERRGGLRPFANRGPSVRFLAPGDDMASPLSESCVCHAESSGASALAAGVALLVLEANPWLRADELKAVLRTTAEPPTDITPEQLHQLVDWWDILPLGRDADGHNAKCGHGRLHAQRACLAVSDPVCAALIVIGEDDAALRWFDLRASAPKVRDLYSAQLGQRMARRCLSDEAVLGQVCTIVRHLRLCAGRWDRFEAHGAGALVRQLVLALRAMAVGDGRQDPTDGELDTLDALAHSLVVLLSSTADCVAVETAALQMTNEVFAARTAS